MGPCDWPIPDNCCTLPPEIPALVVEQAGRAAVEWLWNASGRRYGLCERTVRPCRLDCPSVASMPVPVRLDGEWVNVGCGWCGDKCSCGRVCQTVLPAPVASIVEVEIDGEALDASAYRVDNYDRLIREDGGCWPRCQHYGRPAGDDGTWTVTFMHGIEVPDGGQLAAGLLACELAKAACNLPCDLPARTTQVTRQGVTIVIDPDSGATGIWLVDSWVDSVRTSVGRTGIWSPDRPQPVETTWPV